MTNEQVELIKRALDACRYELATLVPRLTPAFRSNAEACIKLADEALAEVHRQQAEPT